MPLNMLLPILSIFYLVQQSELSAANYLGLNDVGVTQNPDGTGYVYSPSTPHGQPGNPHEGSSNSMPMVTIKRLPTAPYAQAKVPACRKLPDSRQVFIEGFMPRDVDFGRCEGHCAGNSSSAGLPMLPETLHFTAADLAGGNMIRPRMQRYCACCTAKGRKERMVRFRRASPGLGDGEFEHFSVSVITDCRCRDVQCKRRSS